MSSRLFEEIREQRGLCYSVWSIDHAFADMPVLQLGSGLESGKCVEAYRRMREIVAELHDEGPRPDEVDRARAYAGGRRVLMYENTNAVARYAAAQVIVYDAPIDVETAIREIDEVTHDEVAEAARSVDPETLAVAWVGPHSPDEF
jgi:predicted Zn-dependent peptidase